MTETASAKPASQPRIVAIESRPDSNLKFKESMKNHTPSTKIIDRIKKLVAPDNPTCIIDLTPEEAFDLVQTNFERQRNCDTGLISIYKKDFEDNNWGNTGVPLVMSTKWRLLDGQHRLRAYWEAFKENPKKTHSFDIRCFIDEKNFVYYDIGKNRSASDILKIKGVEDHERDLAYAIKLIEMFDKEGKILGLIKGKKVSNKQVDDFYGNVEKRETLLMLLKKAINDWQPKGKYFSLGHWVAIAFTLYNSPKNKRRSIEFLDTLAEGTNLKKNNPIYHLREALNNFEKGRADRKHLTVKWDLTMRSWNHYVNEEKIDSLKPSTNKLDKFRITKPI